MTDTINFSASAGKATPKDREIASRLEDIVGPDLNGDAIFADINQAKFDMSGQSKESALLIYYKLLQLL